MQVVLATGNKGKLREFSSMLEPAGFQFVPQSELGIEGPEETGLNFFDNALLKARHAAQVSGLAAMADDSGLEVDALHGAPGVFSARYAGIGATDHDNVQKLLTALMDLPLEQRTARFRCVIALLEHPGAEPVFGSGEWAGRILLAPRGRNGFGYDPIFEPALALTGTYLGLSAAEMDPRQKQQQSHRARALAALRQTLQRQSGPLTQHPTAREEH
jgi:XTP/dITP diphosphohydrolase